MKSVGKSTKNVKTKISLDTREKDGEVGRDASKKLVRQPRIDQLPRTVSSAAGNDRFLAHVYNIHTCVRPRLPVCICAARA